MGAIVEADFDNREWIEAHDALVTKVVRQETVIECARLCMDLCAYDAARSLLKLTEESK